MQYQFVTFLLDHNLRKISYFVRVWNSWKSTITIVSCEIMRAAGKNCWYAHEIDLPVRESSPSFFTNYKLDYTMNTSNRLSLKSNTLHGSSYCILFGNFTSPHVILHHVFHLCVHNSPLNCILILFDMCIHEALSYTTYRTCTHAHTLAPNIEWHALYDVCMGMHTSMCVRVFRICRSLRPSHTFTNDCTFDAFFDYTKCEPALCFECSLIDPHNNNNGLMYV